MTAFTIGMLAAALWLGVAISIWLLLGASPGDPSRSIRTFRKARGRLAGARLTAFSKTETLRPEPVPLPVETEPNHEETLAIQPDFTSEEGALFPQDPEVVEIERVIESVTGEAPARPRRQPKPRAPQVGPRTKGKVSYFLVDEQGRPVL